MTIAARGCETASAEESPLVQVGWTVAHQTEAASVAQAQHSVGCRGRGLNACQGWQPAKQQKLILLCSLAHKLLLPDLTYE